MVLIVLDLEVLEHGPHVGKIIGNPLILGSDGTVVWNIPFFLIRVDHWSMIGKTFSYSSSELISASRWGKVGGTMRRQQATSHHPGESSQYKSNSKWVQVQVSPNPSQYKSKSKSKSVQVHVSPNPSLSKSKPVLVQVQVNQASSSLSNQASPLRPANLPRPTNLVNQANTVSSANTLCQP